MKSIFAPALLATALIRASRVAADPVSELQARQYSAVISKGCYSSNSGLTFKDTYTWQSKSHCQSQCGPMNAAVEATTKGTDCWCGNSLPPASSLVDDSFCNVQCTGYGAGEMCRRSPSEPCKPPPANLWQVVVMVIIPFISRAPGSCKTHPLVHLLLPPHPRHRHRRPIRQS
jgi:hypothetical protein